MMNMIFSNSTTFVSTNISLIECIVLHHLINKFFRLAPYLYELVIDSLGYLLEVAKMQGKIKGICLLDCSKMVKNEFSDYYFLSISVDQRSVKATSHCLDLLCVSLGVVGCGKTLDSAF
jgi:hypothetical protein